MEKELENLCMEKCEKDTWQTFNPDASMEKFSCGKSVTLEKLIKNV